MSSSSSSIPSTNTKRWASLADRLNPNRPSFDAQLKANWKTMSKKQRKQIIKEEKIQIVKSKNKIKKSDSPIFPTMGLTTNSRLNRTTRPTRTLTSSFDTNNCPSEF